MVMKAKTNKQDKTKQNKKKKEKEAACPEVSIRREKRIRT